jgi:hypothetical protein
MATFEEIDESLIINEAVKIDNSIEYFQYHEYTPQSQENLDSKGSTIQITINATDEYINPSKSYLVIKGKLVRSDNNNPHAANTEIALINNAMMYLFSEIKYEIGGKIMERITDPGQTTSMIGYLTQPDDYSTSSGLKSCWSKDTTNNANSIEFAESVAAPAAGYIPAKNPNYNQGFASRKGLLMSSNPRGNFSFVIPFDHIFGFGEYTKVMYGQKHSLSLTRMTSDNLSIHRADGVQDGKIALNYIAWKVPIVKPSKTALNILDDIIIKKEYLPVAYSARYSESKNVTQTRTFDWTLNVTAGIEKPRWIIVGFQTDKNETQQQNPAVFDHVNLTRAHVNLGSDKYPDCDIISNFQTNDYSELYEMFDNFKKEYYSFNSLVGGTQVNFPAFKSLYPIIVFDVRRQSESLQSTAIDVKLKFFFNEPVPANTMAYATIISNKMGQFGSDGKKLFMLIN